MSTSAGFSGSTIHHRHGLAILLLAVTLTGLMGFSEAAFSTSNLFLRVHFLDVGQGDSALILFPNGAAMLIDGGERSEGPRVAGYLESLGLTSLDVVVATHPHSDHIGGLITVLERFKVGLVVDSGQINPTKTFEDYLNTIDRRNIPFKIGRGGDRLELDPSVQVSIISPPASPFKGTGSDLDANSLVLKIVYKRVSFLFTGDLGGDAESHLTGFDVDVDVLKVAHHGSSSSSSARFLQAATPIVAVISVGEGNPYGHPSRDTLERLISAGAAVYRTDLHGAVMVSTDGDSLLVSAERSMPAQAYTKWESQIFKVMLNTNSEISDYRFIQPAKEVRFTLSGETDTMGFLEVSLPIALIGPPYTVYFDGKPVEAEIHQTCCTASIKLTYKHSLHTVAVAGASAIPEIPAAPLTLTTTAALTLLYIRKRRRGR